MLYPAASFEPKGAVPESQSRSVPPPARFLGKLPLSVGTAFGKRHVHLAGAHPGFVQKGVLSIDNFFFHRIFFCLDSTAFMTARRGRLFPGGSEQGALKRQAVPAGLAPDDES